MQTPVIKSRYGPSDVEAVLFSPDEWAYLASRLDLSARQLDVARLVCDGYKNITVAQRLGVSTETIKTHLRRIYDKLNVNDRFDMLRLIVITIRRECVTSFYQPDPTSAAPADEQGVGCRS